LRLTTEEALGEGSLGDGGEKDERVLHIGDECMLTVEGKRDL